MSKDSILIAATNYEELLDKAVWRRFDYKIKVNLPNKETVRELLDLFLDNRCNISDKEKNMLSYALSETSGADIEELVKKAIRKSIIYDYDINIHNIFNEIFKSKNIGNDENLDEKTNLKTKAKFLRNLDEKVFSYLTIAKCLGVSKTQIASLLKE